MRTKPLARVVPPYAKFLMGAPVRGPDWYTLGQLANWTLGSGLQLVPSCFPERTISAAATDVYRFRVKPRAQGLQRVWGLQLTTTAIGAVTATVKAPASTGDAVDYPVSFYGRGRRATIYVEDVATPSATEQDITIEVTANGGSVKVEAVSCYEQDRHVLTSGEGGVDLDTVLPRQPIVYAAGTSEIATAAQYGANDYKARRGGLLHLVTDEASPWTKSTTGYQNLLLHGVPVLGPKDLIADVTAVTKWGAYAKVTGGTGHVRLTTSNSGVSSVLNITGTSFAWVTATNIAIDCDDMDSADGRQTSASPDWDEAQVAIEGPGGGQTLSVVSASLWVP